MTPAQRRVVLEIDASLGPSHYSEALLACLRAADLWIGTSRMTKQANVSDIVKNRDLALGELVRATGADDGFALVAAVRAHLKSEAER